MSDPKLSSFLSSAWASFARGLTAMEDALEEYRINGRAWEAEDELDISKKYRANVAERDALVGCLKSHTISRLELKTRSEVFREKSGLILEHAMRSSMDEKNKRTARSPLDFPRVKRVPLIRTIEKYTVVGRRRRLDGLCVYRGAASSKEVYWFRQTPF
ncbi:hypothetical protein B0H14DRAFT_2759256 [Mycena olivaceomarginata]|nr:hypothetical protein B0H14DRAFT_2759256 [Mycena olivaceomarginata]